MVIVHGAPPALANCTGSPLRKGLGNPVAWWAVHATHRNLSNCTYVTHPEGP